MTGPDDRDLAGAFEELSAPPSTADYATRTPGLEVRTSSRRWPQALATALAVVVAAGGATTFLALRSARQGGSPSSSTGAPPARTGAVIAYDSTSGVSVMFGGISGAGQLLADSWTWDGSVWRSAAQGPGPLAGARLVDDPADGGLLLVGAPAPPASGGVVSSGCAGGGTAVPGTTVSGGTPVGSIGSSTAGNAPASTPPPAIAPVPADVVPSPRSTESGSPVTLCPAPVAPPSVQTWIFNSSGWHRAVSGSVAATPSAGAELAFDPTSRQVVAVSPPGFACGPPLEVPVRSGSAIACPALGSTSSSSAAGLAPCGAAVSCLRTRPLSAWTWSGGSWRQAPVDASLQPSGTTLLFTDPATQHAVLMSQSGIGSSSGIAYPQVACAPTQACPTTQVPKVTTWIWSGVGWMKVSEVHAPQQGPDLSGASVAATEGHLVVLTVSGETWTFAAGQWTQDSPSRHPDARTGAAVGEGPNGTVVLFGGVASPGFFVTTSGHSVGSDTWLWNGRGWEQRGGTAPSAPPLPSTFPCGPTGKAAIPPCVVPQPAEVPPATPVSAQPTP